MNNVLFDATAEGHDLRAGARFRPAVVPRWRCGEYSSVAVICGDGSHVDSPWSAEHYSEFVAKDDRVDPIT